jgi:hypothetical protein
LAAAVHDMAMIGELHAWLQADTAVLKVHGPSASPSDT